MKALTAIDQLRIFRMARLGGAELELPGRPRSREEAQAEFLIAIKTRPEARRAIEALKSDVGPLHSEIFLGLGWCWPSSLPPDIRQSVFGRKKPATRQEFRKALEAWADRFNLARSGKGKWIYTVAKHTLRLWETSPQAAERLIWDLPGSPHPQFPEDPWVFEFSPWDPTSQTRGDYRASTAKAFAQQLDHHLQESEDALVSRGATRTRGSVMSDHYEWLVRRQIETESLLSIASSPPRSVSVDAVKAAIRQLRNLIDLPSLRPGRPPKKG